MKTEELENKLENLHEQHRHIIKSYCDYIGCADCPLIKYQGDDCKSNYILDQIIDIEKQLYNL